MAKFGCDLDATNNEGFSPCDFSEEPLEQILRCASSLPFQSLYELILCYSIIHLPQEQKILLEEFVPQLKKDQVSQWKKQKTKSLIFFFFLKK